MNIKPSITTTFFTQLILQDKQRMRLQKCLFYSKVNFFLEIIKIIEETLKFLNDEEKVNENDSNFNDCIKKLCMQIECLEFSPISIFQVFNI